MTIQETKLTPKAQTPKIHNFTSVRTDRLHKAGGGLITLIRDNITFTPSTINTHNTELQMVMVHINNTKHITIAKIYIPPRDTTSTHYKTADTDIQHCIQYITNIPHSVLTGDVNAHSTLWHSYTDTLTEQHTTHNIQGCNITLTTSQVQEAIKQSKNNNSQGPDKLNIRHLKHTGPLGLAFLTSMFKTSLNKNIIPHTWKLANIVPTQNPTKTQTRAPHTGPYPSSQ